MTSTLTLYYKSLINKDKNFILDKPNGKSAIENYLTTLESQVISGFQYVKHGLAVTIKLNKSQDELMMGHNARDLNYIKIQNGTENPYYYFIIKKDWKSENTIELLLNMDTLNTFEFNKDYEINKKTLVKREHKDRLKSSPYIEKVFEWDITEDGGRVSATYSSMIIAISEFRDYSIELLPGTTVTGIDPGYPDIEETSLDGIHVFRFLLPGASTGHVQLKFRFRCWAFEREIDMRSEEINCPVYKVQDELLYEQDGNSSANWSLYYKNKYDPDDPNTHANPVDCYLLTDEPYTAEYQTSDGHIDQSDCPSDGDYIILYSIDGLSVNVNGSEYYLRRSTGWSWGEYVNWTLIAVKKQDSNVQVFYAKMEYKKLFFPSIPVFSGEWTKIWEGAYIEVQTLLDTMTTRRVESLPTSAQWIASNVNIGDAWSVSFGTTATTAVVSLQNIDKTDSKNIKIIDLPYSPTTFSIENGNYVIGDMWKFDTDTNMMKLRNNMARFTNDIRSQAVNPEINMLLPYDGSLDLKNISRRFKDSKLFHSDYFRPKFVYDSFSRTFPLEKIEFTYRESYLFSFHFTMSRNIVSKFLFSFDYNYKVAVEDFEKIVACSRNNEEVLYNSAYLNYIRTGYNYDLKSKERQDVTGAVGIGLNVATLVSSVILAVATENPLPLAGAVASGIGLVGQTINYAKTTAQNEDNIQRKLQETQQQAVSVMNADDIDLLYEYCQNKAKLCSYKVSEQMENILDDLFYYGGYVCNEQKIPNVKSRYWFNYVQASLILEETNNLTEEIENDIKEKFENGVTFMHLRNNTFDLKQEKENMETSIVGG